MNDNHIFCTPEGLEKLNKEFKDLVDVKRLEVVQRVQKARELGDISENAEYTAAREEHAMIEGRITELKEILRRAEVVTKKSGDEVDVGCNVLVHIEGQDQRFHIVGPTEADPLQGKISHESPLGQALLGKKVGETIEVEAPAGSIIYKILKISF